MPTGSNVLCGCGRFMHVKQNSVTVEERLEDQSPYKLWDADLYECPECGVEVITGFGRAPLAEYWTNIQIVPFVYERKTAGWQSR